MGMFDSVVFVCLRCGKLVEFQSKAGKCLLHTYPPHAVPVEIAKDIQDNEYGVCSGCAHEYEAFMIVQVSTVSMCIMDKS